MGRAAARPGRTATPARERPAPSWTVPTRSVRAAGVDRQDGGDLGRAQACRRRPAGPGGRTCQTQGQLRICGSTTSSDIYSETST